MSVLCSLYCRTLNSRSEKSEGYQSSFKVERVSEYVGQVALMVSRL